MKHTWSRLTCLMLVSMIFGSGCATSPGTHLGNLKNDFLDISRLNAGVGPFGYGVDVKATKYLELKADNYENVYKAGWIGRGCGVWKEDSKGYAISTKQIPITTAVRTNRTGEGSSTVTETSSMGFEAEYLLGGSQLLSDEKMLAMSKVTETMDDSETLAMYQRAMQIFTPADEFRLALYLGVVGVDLGLRPVELLDFACSLLTLGYIDIRKDDHGSIEQSPAGDVLKAAPEE